ATAPINPAPFSNLLVAIPAKLSNSDATSTFSIFPCDKAIRSNAFSFSKDRTRILSSPRSIERSVSSMPFPMPSMEANDLKINVNVLGKRNTSFSVRVCSFSTASRSAPRANTPASSTPSTNDLALIASSKSSITGPPANNDVQNLRKPDRTFGFNSSIIPKS
ncbi:hypothetical protein ACHAWO_011598, partial [Cyclotella atomus]